VGDSWQKILVGFVIISLIIPPGLNNFTDDPSLQIQDAFAIPQSIPNNGKTVDDVVHFLIQFDEIPNAAQKKNISSGLGVNLVSYVSDNTYIGSSNIPDLSSKIPEHAKAYGVSSVIALDSSVKTSANLKVNNIDDIGSWAKVGENQVVVTIQLHGDVDVSDGENLVEELGGEVLSVVPNVPAILAEFDFDIISEISEYDIVLYVDIAEPKLGEHNDGARTAANIAPLNVAPFGLTGSGVTVLVYDSGMVESTHPDFAGRIVELDGDASETVRDHSTHVAGTVGGDGSNSNGNDSVGNPNGGSAGQWAGMAPAVNIRSFGSSGSSDVLYNDIGDLFTDFSTAVNSGIDLATMSLGNNVVSNGFPCAQLGDYTFTALVIDAIVLGLINGQQLTYFESAGNERQLMAPCGQFATISSPSTAKNSISVGAINSNDNSITGFTSFGPTDDGRLKPDVVGPGCQSTGDGGLTSPSFIDGGAMNGNLDAGETTGAYVVKCGTSMSAPATAGLGALITEQWQTFNGAGARPLPHTMKAILVHTATDLDDVGPDYRTGYGAINGVAAVNLVISDNTESIINLDDVGNGNTVHYTFNSDGLLAPRITSVWDDFFGATLINDLNLRVEGPDGTIYQPYLLDPNNPDTPATTGNDNTNNVEMVDATSQEGTWEVRVSGAAVPFGPQQFSLITPEDAVADNQRPVADANGPYEGPEGTDIDLDGTGSSDPDGDALTFEWDFDNDGSFDDATGATPTYDDVGDNKVVTIKLKVTDSNGAFDIDETTLTLNNVVPTIDSLSANDPIDEGQTVTVDGTASDPGWLDDLSATIDWDDGNGEQNMAEDSEENVRPDATLDFSASLKYGDDGVFNTEVCVEDDDGGEDCNALDITVNNVDPTAVIDESSTIMINGMTVFFATIGEDIDFSGNSMDPGSDDLTIAWNWDDGAPAPDVSTVYLVNDPLLDPLKSPTDQPRDVTDDKTHAFADACLYEIALTSVDDDGGDGEDSATVIIVGDAELARSAGYWQQQVKFTILFTESIIAICSSISSTVEAGLRKTASASVITSLKVLASGIVSPSVSTSSSGPIVPFAKFSQPVRI